MDKHGGALKGRKNTGRRWSIAEPLPMFFSALRAYATHVTIIRKTITAHVAINKTDLNRDENRSVYRMTPI